MPAPTFGVSSSGPSFGAPASTPALRQGTEAELGTPAFGLGKGQPSGAPFAFGASGGASFGSASSGGAFGVNAAATSAQSTAPASAATGFTFGGSVPLTFGAQSSAASGGTGAAAPAFGAHPLTAGGHHSLLSAYRTMPAFWCHVDMRRAAVVHAAQYSLSRQI